MPRGGRISARCAKRSCSRDRSVAGWSETIAGCGPAPGGSESVAGSSTPAPTTSSNCPFKASNRLLAAVPMNAKDVADALELGEDARELLDARHLQGRIDRRGLVRIRLRRQREEIHLVIADHRGHVAEEAIAIPPFDADGHRIGARRRALPLDVDESLLVGGPLHVRAVRAMHRYAATARDISGDLVSGYWVAADAEAHQQVADALHVHPAPRGVRGKRRREIGDRK